jgi:hypothetical protein
LTIVVGRLLASPTPAATPTPATALQHLKQLVATWALLLWLAAVAAMDGVRRLLLLLVVVVAVVGLLLLLLRVVLQLPQQGLTT